MPTGDILDSGGKTLAFLGQSGNLSDECSCDRRNGRIPEPCFGGTIITTAVLYPSVVLHGMSGRRKGGRP
jgi:hypothetical protein